MEDEAETVSGSAKCQVSIELDPDADDLCNGDTAIAAVSAPDPPEIPQFLDNVRVDEVTPEIQRILALVLDLPSPSPSVKNWEWLASKLGMPPEEITYIRERSRYPDSPTLIVLRQFRGENFSRILHIIRDGLSRYDVIIQLMPSLLAFEEYRRSSKTKQTTGAAAFPSSSAVPASNGGQSLSSVDSGIVGTSLATNNASLSGIVGSPACQSNDRPLVLVTFAEDNPKHKSLIRWLCKNLENSDFGVICDDSLAGKDDWMSRTSQCFEQARAIVVACSPSYNRRVDGSMEGDVPQLLDNHIQCTRFIYQLMCAEYTKNKCTNRRFRPIICDTAPCDRSSVPPILRNTVIHSWPRQHNEFMRFLYS